MIEVLVEGVVWLLLEGLGAVPRAVTRIPFRVWASVGLIALGLVAVNTAFAGTGPTRTTLFLLTGACLVLSPAVLFLVPDRRR